MAIKFNGRLKTSNTKLNNTTMCGECGLYRECNSPKLKEIGENQKNILIIRGFPSKEDDVNNKPFSGETFNELYSILKENNINMYKDCVMMTATACYVNHYQEPAKASASISYCYPTIKKAIVKYKPKVILLCGFDAVKSFIGRKYPKDLGGKDAKKDKTRMGKWRGWSIPNQEFNCWVCPIFDPHDIAKMNDGGSKKGQNVYKTHLTVWKQDIKRALSLLDKEVPDYKNLERFCKVFNENQALEWIEEAKTYMMSMIKKGLYPFFVFDFETNMLKAHNKNAKIFSISISVRDNEAVSFRWTDKIRDALRPVFLHKKVRKCGHNGKFDCTWLKWVCNIDVANFYFDTMLSSHVIDNRSNITGLKFQSFVNFDVIDYSSHISNFLKAPTSYSENTIHKAPEYDVLLYGGMDALLTRMLAKKHLRIIGMPFET